MECNFNLTKISCNQTIDVMFRDLSYAVRTRYRGPKKQILKGLDGIFRSTELTAIIGPSGAGKSTLLNILSGFQEGSYTGTVEYLNQGNKQSQRSCKKQLRYIQQTNNLYDYFTINEIMMIASYLKIDRSISRTSRQILINDILSTLSLLHIKETRTDRLSGGEKKRLSIALELIDNPSLIFLDEPTTGLDSSAAVQCVTVLKKLAKTGRTIICAIHQPSAALYEMFDLIYLVVDGYCMYRSPPGDTVNYFARQGLQCPKYHNPADYMLEVVSKEYGNYDEQLIAASKWSSESNDEVRSSNSSYDMIQNISDNNQMIALSCPPTELMRFWVLLQRYIMLTYRNRQTVYISLSAHLFVSILTGLFYEHIGDDANKLILNNTKHIGKGQMYDLLRPWLNDGLLLSTGAKWHSRRKMLTPTFHFSILREFTNILTEEGKRMVQKLKDVGDMVEVDIELFISEHTLNIICETAMGTSPHNLGTMQEKYRHKVHQLGQLLVYRIVRPWLLNDIIFALTPKGREQKKILQNLHGFTEKIIAERKMYHKRTNNKELHNIANNDPIEIDNAEIHGIRKKRIAMLDLLISISQENNLSDLDIREEVDTFTFEGHDTISMAICFTLLLLAEHKDIQDRVREEVKTVMQQCEGKLTMTSLQNLSYLERCLKESLRLYPSVHFITRITAEDVQLRDSYVIPRGTITHLNIFDAHRDPNFWPNPDVFDPDRFLPEKIQKRHPYSYLPFSAGPRNCIGQRFAMLELKAIIALLVHNFYLEPINYLKDMRINIDLVLRPNNMKIKFVPIQAA